MSEIVVNQEPKEAIISDDVLETMDVMMSSTSSNPNIEFVRQQRFEVGPRYHDLKFVGEGAYGRSIH